MIITRKDAVTQGLTHFFTGKPCNHGHFAPRFASTGACSECKKTEGKRVRSVPNRFYVYLYLDKKGIPYYVGKGQRRRAWESHGDVTIPPEKQIVIAQKELTNEESLELEAKLIEKYGLIHNGTGCLQNSMTKGSRGSTGKKQPPELIAKRVAGIKGKKRTPEQRARLGVAKAAPRKWFHPDHGEIVAGASELSRMFFGDTSHNGMFVSLYKGTRRQHHGWTCLNPEKTWVLRKKPAATVDWYHAEHGAFHGSDRDLVRAFPEQKLAQGNLCRVKNGRFHQAKGWRCVAA